MTFTAMDFNRWVKRKSEGYYGPRRCFGRLYRRNYLKLKTYENHNRLQEFIQMIYYVNNKISETEKRIDLNKVIIKEQLNII